MPEHTSQILSPAPTAGLANPTPAGLDTDAALALSTGYTTYTDELSGNSRFSPIGSRQVLVTWCIYAMYDFGNLLGCYGALGKTIDDDHIETF